MNLYLENYGEMNSNDLYIKRSKSISKSENLKVYLKVKIKNSWRNTISYSLFLFSFERIPKQAATIKLIMYKR